MTSVKEKLRKNALCFDQSALSNFALYVIISEISLPRVVYFCFNKVQDVTVPVSNNSSSFENPPVNLCLHFSHISINNNKARLILLDP